MGATVHGVQGFLIAVASLISEHRLNSGGARAYLLRGKWDLQAGFEPESPALTGEFFTTEPPGKPLFFKAIIFKKEFKKKKEPRPVKTQVRAGRKVREVLSETGGRRCW